MPSFIESGFSTRAEYEAAGGAAGATMTDCPVLGYHKIRGLAGPPRMMFFYKGQKFKNKTYGDDLMEAWHGGEKSVLKQQNSMINLPYVIDGETVVTQSNSVLVYLGKRLGIDKEEHFIHNHQALDQTMDLRNDLMKIVYSGKKDQLVDDFTKHMKGSASTHLTKLENFCKGPYLCGPTPQSADFSVFEMLDQHFVMVADLKVAFDTAAFPKLLALHSKMKAEPSLAKYFASPMYSKYSFNNAMFTVYVGPSYDGDYKSTDEVITP